ncbi:MAG TPA: bifunctional 4-hydroxy-2-oxoglutarate aldolase/2-dehydro-3-deoxy-phosphogluconate aldolase [Cyclobacteriaceae bacterium]|nr:bifunctional 4-hydroxy-2-oxoglutarate aldolase/2-dehydro-3-deoxy-phosphogluconate aldolase [Cyclobacteriaceae bacterium]
MSAQQSLIDKICGDGILPLYADDNPTRLFRVIDALVDGGVRTFEFTNRKPNALQVFEALVGYARQYPDLHLGAGTVLDGDTALRFIKAGASFIVAPTTQAITGSVCADAQVLWIPGAATPTEISSALEMGAGIVKVFPGSVLGPEFVRSIRSVMPDVPLMVTGGVEPTELSMSSWFNAGAQCVGLGSQLFSHDIILGERWSELTSRAADCVSIARQLKGR